jgi:hypothetical protein
LEEKDGTMGRGQEVALASTDGTWNDRKKEEMERWEERRIKGQKEWKDGSTEERKEGRYRKT